MATHNAVVGMQGENAALGFFLQQGFRLAAQNVRYRCGELDLLVTSPDGVLVVVEVKTRLGRSFGTAEAVTPAKFARMRKAAAQWLLDSKEFYSAVRFDVLVVELTSNGPVFEHFIGVEHGAW